MERYYQAALIEYIIQWWEQSDRSWDIKQMNIKMSLNEWCLQDEAGIKLNTTNCTLGVFMKIWGKCSKQLLPTLSPLASVVWHPRFHHVITTDNFHNWRLVGLDRFGSLGKNRSICAREELLCKIGDMSCSRLQYKQVSFLVLVLVRRENVTQNSF